MMFIKHVSVRYWRLSCHTWRRDRCQNPAELNIFEGVPPKLLGLLSDVKLVYHLQRLLAHNVSDALEYPAGFWGQVGMVHSTLFIIHFLYIL